jgi:hypothetical protein
MTENGVWNNNISRRTSKRLSMAGGSSRKKEIMEITNLRSISDLVSATETNIDAAVATIRGREDEPAFRAYADFGIPWYHASCQTEAGLKDIESYRALVKDKHLSAWMDNTTIVTAATLMSPSGPGILTPLTLWDLATFARAVICYDHIYHHRHPQVPDAALNKLLKDEVFITVPLPFRETGGRLLPDPWDGAHRWFCETWSEAESWLTRLHQAIGSDTLDGHQVQAVTEAWRAALDRQELQPSELVDHKGIDRRWRSPTNELLVDTVNITDPDDTRIYVDSTENFELQFAKRREFGLPDLSRERRSALLSDLNLRAHINQSFANFFALPYACSAARIPFRKHLFDRVVKVQQELVTAKVIDQRYGELAAGVQLRLPIFLALSLQRAKQPKHVWDSLAELRVMSSDFRTYRFGFDNALARGDLKAAREMSKALHTTVEKLVTVAGKATTAVTTAVVEDVAKGDLSWAGTSISALRGATKGVLKSSFTDRLLWRLRKPELLWVNNVIDQAHHLTEALPKVSAIWEIPPNRQDSFIKRFKTISTLAG